MAISRVRDCSIAEALSIVGDRWTLLAVRELMFGVTRFNDIAEHTGASRDILTSRLRRLESEGYIRREKYSDRPPRFDYRLTGSGEQLLPLLLALMRLGDDRRADSPPVTWRHGRDDGEHDLVVEVTCHVCGEPATQGIHSPHGIGVQ
ncbi:winged helix-turn-helix transcriptional regulator [Arthrobacter sp. L77]|uniref:winged helix-turn-helix transcriptional regulator n=1 Tax=Arthrobacter sp. L77 TaxID=1496689 RepID=UPI0005BCD214|nr:helix-turn-helix domain-containing protein [Arthrobacter sp. L77]